MDCGWGGRDRNVDLASPAWTYCITLSKDWLARRAFKVRQEMAIRASSCGYGFLGSRTKELSGAGFLDVTRWTAFAGARSAHRIAGQRAFMATQTGRRLNTKLTFENRLRIWKCGANCECYELFSGRKSGRADVAGFPGFRPRSHRIL